MKKIYGVILDPDVPVLNYSDDMNVVEKYLNFIDKRDIDIIEFTEDQFEMLKESNSFDSINLIENFGKDIYITQSELELTSMELEYECLKVTKKLKKIKKQLKIFKSKYTKDLIKSIEKFLKDDNVKHKNPALDFLSVEGRLIEKIKERYYIKGILRREYNNYNGDENNA